MNDPRLPARSRSLLLWVALATAAGCGGDGCGSGGDDGGAGACEAGLLPGDLVITELMIDPAGADSGREWLEIYNAGPMEVDLQGVLLVHSAEDGTNAKLHRIGRSWLIPSDDYGVAGAVLDEEDVLVLLPHVDYGYAEVLGDMRNTAGRLAVACESEVIDDVIYGEATEGAARGFTGDRTPDATGNDDLTLWCDASTELDAESRGTPGEPNDICVGTGGPLSCIDGGTLREARAPVLGDIVVAEVLANPEASEEGDGEWLELYVGADIDLNGVALGTDPTGVEAEPVASNECVPVAAGTRLVFAASDDPTLNGGLPQVDQPLGFSLRNSDGQVVVSYAGEVLDVLAYGTAPTGAAVNLDPSYHTPEDNDDPRYLCAATTPFGAGDLGTPGQANVACDIPAPEGQCLDADGSFRDVVAPAPGDLVVTEVMANPEAAAEEGDSEWLELQALGTFDLNGLHLGTVEGEVRDTIESAACLPMQPGDHAVIAREADPAINGGLPQVDATFGFSLVNSNGVLWVGTDQATVDLVGWASVPAGAARSLDPSAADPQANDDEAAWCPAITAYGDGDLGTPGADNPSCGTVPTGTCLDGGVERDVVIPQLGDLVITEWMADPSIVADAEGEWFEILATASVDLNGLQLANDAALTDASLPAGGDCLAVAAGEYAVVARGDDPLVNGGLPPVVGTFGFGLTNSGGALYVGLGGEVLDAVTWATSTPGAATTVDPSAEDPVGNDDPANACTATTPFSGGLGTPGAQGPACGGGMAGDGMCLDGGVARPIVYPTAGQLVLNEWMPNPDVVSDTNGEWFELYVGAAVDLNELQLSRFTAGAFQLETTLAAADCLTVPAGSYVVFAKSLDPLVNGALPVADFAFAFSLNNTSSGLAVGVADVHLDEVQWAGSTAGAATSLDPAAQTTAGNDVAGNLCPATDPYGPGDNSGTPGAANPAC